MAQYSSVIQISYIWLVTIRHASNLHMTYSIKQSGYRARYVAMGCLVVKNIKLELYSRMRNLIHEVSRLPSVIEKVARNYQLTYWP